MISLHRFRNTVLLLAPFLALLAWAASASAQLAVSIVMERKELIPYEPVRVGVEMTNRSAKPILLATATDDGTSWIKFRVTNDRGNELPMVGQPAAIAPFQLRPGQTIRHIVNVGSMYPLLDYGGYSIQSSVFVPADNAYAGSNNIRVNVVGAREIWSTAFGVPVGNPDGGGTSRIFRLQQLRTTEKSYLFARLDDRATGRVLSCFPIGQTLDIRPPSYTVDGEGNLHVLYQVSPDISNHVVVNCSGKLVGVTAHADVKNSRPTLTAAADNSIGVIGGRPYDAEVERIRKMSIRRISERPSGLNEVLGRGVGGGAPAANKPDPNYQPVDSLEQP